MLSMLAAPGMARVFWRRSTAGAALFDNTPGWQTVYRAAVRVNGCPGALRLVSCDDDLDAAAARLRAAWVDAGAEFDVGAGTGIRTGLARMDDRAWRFLLLTIPEPGKTVIFSLEQSAADYRRSLDRPAGGRPSDLPAYPGSQPDLLVENEDTRALLAVSTAAAAPATVLNYFRDALADQGYRTLAPAAAAAPGAGFLLYSKRGVLCCVLARSAAPGQTVITVLKKKLE